MADKKTLGIGVFIIILVSGITWTINETITDKEGNTYYPYNCIDKVGYCFKLSKINDDGFQTRCYHNASLPRSYKKCNTGWNLFNGTQAIGNETIIESSIEEFSDKVMDCIFINETNITRSGHRVIFLDDGRKIITSASAYDIWTNISKT